MLKKRHRVKKKGIEKRHKFEFFFLNFKKNSIFDQNFCFFVHTALRTSLFIRNYRILLLLAFTPITFSKLGQKVG